MKCIVRYLNGTYRYVPVPTYLMSYLNYIFRRDPGGTSEEARVLQAQETKDGAFRYRRYLLGACFKNILLLISGFFRNNALSKHVLHKHIIFVSKCETAPVYLNNSFNKYIYFFIS